MNKVFDNQAAVVASNLIGLCTGMAANYGLAAMGVNPNARVVILGAAGAASLLGSGISFQRIRTWANERFQSAREIYGQNVGKLDEALKIKEARVKTLDGAKEVLQECSVAMQEFGESSHLAFAALRTEERSENRADGTGTHISYEMEGLVSRISKCTFLLSTGIATSAVGCSSSFPFANYPSLGLLFGLAIPVPFFAPLLMQRINAQAGAVFRDIQEGVDTQLQRSGDVVEKYSQIEGSCLTEAMQEIEAHPDDFPILQERAEGHKEPYTEEDVNAVDAGVMTANLGAAMVKPARQRVGAGS